MKKTLRKILSAAVCISLMLSMLTVFALAADKGSFELKEVESPLGTVKLVLTAKDFAGLTQGKLTLSRNTEIFPSVKFELGKDAGTLKSTPDAFSASYSDETKELSFSFKDGLKTTSQYASEGQEINGDAFEAAVLTLTVATGKSVNNSVIALAGKVSVQGSEQAVNASFTCIDMADEGDVLVKEDPKKALFLNEGILCISPDLTPSELLEISAEGATLSESVTELKTGMKLRLKSGDVTLLIMGDLNCDGKISAADARVALRNAVGLDALNPIQQYAAMVTDDQKVSAEDARLILRAAVGLEKIRLRVVTAPSESSKLAFDSVKTKLKAESTKGADGLYTLTAPVTSASGMEVVTKYSYNEANESIIINADFANGTKISVEKQRNSNMATLKISFEFLMGTVSHFVRNTVSVNAADLTRSTNSFDIRNLTYSENGYGRENSTLFCNSWLPAGISACDSALVQATGVSLCDIGFMLYSPSSK